VARLGVALVALASMGLFVAGLPYRLAQLKWMASLSRLFLHFSPTLAPRFRETLRTLLDTYPYVSIAIELAVMILFFISVLIIFLRSSNEWMTLILVGGLMTYGIYLLPALDALMAAQPAVRMAGNALQAMGLASSLLFFYTFPNGRFVPRWTAGLLVFWGLWGLAWVFGPARPFNLSDPYNFSLPMFTILMAWWLSGVAAQLYRYNKVSNPVQRQQTKFIVFGVTFAVVSYGLYVPIREALPGNASYAFHLVGVPIFLLCVALIPISITTSILRYRLWDIDFVIRRTVSYAALTAVLGLTYIGSIVLLTNLFRQLTGQTQSGMVTAVTTLALALAFQPARLRVQDFINRRYYRRKYDAENALAQFGESVSAEMDLNRLTNSLIGAVESTMQPQHVSIWLLPAESPPQESANDA